MWKPGHVYCIYVIWLCMILNRISSRLPCAPLLINRIINKTITEVINVHETEFTHAIHDSPINRVRYRISLSICTRYLVCNIDSCIGWNYMGIEAGSWHIENEILSTHLRMIPKDERACVAYKHEYWLFIR